MQYQSVAVDLERPVIDLHSRTTLSVEFEALWRGIPKAGLMPNRSAFRPEKAARFLRHLVLCEVSPDGPPRITMRLTGSEFEHRLHRNVVGEDYLQFLPAALHAGAMDAVRQIVRRPCGLWQIMPLQYDRGYARNVEITVFPLKHDKPGTFMLLILTQFMDKLLPTRSNGDAVLTAETALTFEYIDVGAGVPP